MKPTRWLQAELPDALRDELQEAVNEPLRADQLARVRAKLSGTLGPEFAPLQVPATAPANVQLALWSKALGLAAIAGLGALLWTQPRAAEPRSSSALQAASAVPVSTPAARTEAPQLDSAPALPAPTQSTGAEPIAPRPRERSSAAATSRGRKLPVREPGLAEELQQLETIRVELERAPERALAAAALHERRFPQGALVPERELLKLEAWLRLGQHERAQRAAAHALAGHSGQPYRAQVLALLQRYPQPAETLTQHGRGRSK